MKSLPWLALGALLLGPAAGAEIVKCPDGNVWAGNDLSRCPCCTQCSDGTWVKDASACPKPGQPGAADDCARFADLVPLLGIEDPVAESVHNIRPRDRVEVWEKPTSAGKGTVIGHIPTGSRAEILDEDGEDLRVRSSRVAVVGWIGKNRVERIVLRNRRTGKLCGSE